MLVLLCFFSARSCVPEEEFSVEPTHLSFIQQLKEGSGETWRELDRVYRPRIVYWLKRHGLHANERACSAHVRVSCESRDWTYFMKVA